MMDNHSPGSPSVYHARTDRGDTPPLRAFFVDVYDEDTDRMEHAYYGVVQRDGDGGIARTLRGRGFHSFADVESLADRIGGEVVWV